LRLWYENAGAEGISPFQAHPDVQNVIRQIWLRESPLHITIDKAHYFTRELSKKGG
jgi:hypothetical protein